MDVFSSKLPLATLTAMSLLCVLAHEVTVRNTDLKLCTHNNTMCVTELSNCERPPPASVQNALNMSCYFEKSNKTVTCEWSQEPDSLTESDVYLLFIRKRPIISCQTVFSMSSQLTIAAKIKNYNMGTEIWSQLQNVFLFHIVKPSPPILTVLGSTDDTVVVSWRSSGKGNGSCRLRYRDNTTLPWSQAPDLFLTHKDQTLNYTIKDLLPFKVYLAAVACREQSNIWSNWSSEVKAKTLDREPFKPPKVCYRVETTNRHGRFLHLMWKALDSRDAGSRVLGYQVSYWPAKKLQDSLILNTKEATASLEVKEGKWNITVKAFNMAGYGPAAHLSVDTQRHNSVPSVTNMWVSSSFPALKGLMVEWQMPTDLHSLLPVDHFDVQWHVEEYPSTSRWSTVNGSTTFAFIQDLDCNTLYQVSVFPVYKQQCGSPGSLPASLEEGALKEPDNLKVIGVTMTTVTVGWEWRRKSGQIRVERYRVMLKRDAVDQTLSLWHNQLQHTFFNLTPSTEYSLVLWADNNSTHNIKVRTDFDRLPLVATATPLLLLAVTVLIISMLSRTVYKWYFFPQISSPQGSTTGRWLMDPNRQNYTNILEIKDFQEAEVLRVKSAIFVGPNALLSSEEDLHENGERHQRAVKLSDITLDADYVFNAPPTTEQDQLQCQHPEIMVMFDESRRHQTWFPQKEEERRQLDCQMSQRVEEALKSCIDELMADGDRSCVDQMICEGDYAMNSSIMLNTDPEAASEQTGCSVLIVDTDYIANSCFTAKTTYENGAGDISTAC